MLLYLNQEGRGIGLANKMRAYALQDQGFDTVEANHRLGFEDDERDFRIGANILKELGFSRVRLMTNNPRKVAMMQGCGLEVVERVPLKVGRTRFNTALSRHQGGEERAPALRRALPMVYGVLLDAHIMHNPCTAHMLSKTVGIETLTVGRWGARFRGRWFPCAVGRGGIGEKRAEGDGITPVGRHRIEAVLRRPDRAARAGGEPIGPRDGWSDDPADPDYNRRVLRPHRFGHEALRRADPMYDLVAVHGLEPASAGEGAGERDLPARLAEAAASDGGVHRLPAGRPRLDPGALDAARPGGGAGAGLVRAARSVGGEGREPWGAGGPG